MKYDIILWDLDDTLLDFKYSEKHALLHTSKQFQIVLDEFMLKRYSDINEQYWKKLEKGEITKECLLWKRFSTFFEEFHISGIDVKEFALKYREGLGTYVKCNQDALFVLDTLKGKARQFIVTNGVYDLQLKKIKMTGIYDYMEDIFISEKLGAEKPQSAFFEGCFQKLGEFDKNKIVVIGDSLTSDILGGVNAKLHTCWFNKEQKANNTEVIPDYEIRNLSEVLNLVF